MPRGGCRSTTPDGFGSLRWSSATAALPRPPASETTQRPREATERWSGRSPCRCIWLVARSVGRHAGGSRADPSGGGTGRGGDGCRRSKRVRAGDEPDLLADRRHSRRGDNPVDSRARASPADHARSGVRPGATAGRQEEGVTRRGRAGRGDRLIVVKKNSLAEFLPLVQLESARLGDTREESERW